MAIKQYDTQEEMDEDFEQLMDKMQTEAHLKDAIGMAQERRASIMDDLNDIDEELQDLHQQLNDLDL